MSWPARFLPVPVDRLTIDPSVTADSIKASAADMRSWMAAVPEVYRMLENGYRDVDFYRMSTSPINDHAREVGEAYRHLWSDSPSAQPLRAEFVDGVGLQVVKGQHRALAARAEGVPFVPVHVSAPEQVTLDRISNQMESEVAALDPQAVAIHRTYDAHQRQIREEAPSLPTVRPLHEHLELELDRAWWTPDRRR